MSNFEDLKIKFSLSIGYANAGQEDEEPLSDYFSEADWNAMNDGEKNKALSEITNGWAENHIELSGWVE